LIDTDAYTDTHTRILQIDPVCAQHHTLLQNITEHIQPKKIKHLTTKNQIFKSQTERDEMRHYTIMQNITQHNHTKNCITQSFHKLHYKIHQKMQHQTGYRIKHMTTTQSYKILD